MFLKLVGQSAVVLRSIIGVSNRLRGLCALATAVALILGFVTNGSLADEALTKRLDLSRALNSLRLAGAQTIESITRGMKCDDVALEKAMRKAAREFVTHTKAETEELNKPSPDFERVSEHFRHSLKANEEVVGILERCADNLSRRRVP